jgi:hypothetical protein
MSSPNRLSLHIAASEVPLVSDFGENRSDLALVVSGQSVQWTRLRGDFPDAYLTVDYGGWRADHAAPDAPMGDARSQTLFNDSVREYIDGALLAGADQMLSPVACVRPGDQDSVTSCLNLADSIDQDEFVPLLAVPFSMLIGGESWLKKSLTSFGKAVALVVVGKPESVLRENRLATLRSLVTENLVSHVLATDPVVAADAFAYGANSSTGISSGYRIPDQPSQRGPFAQGYLPAIFARELLETRSPDWLADLFAGFTTAPTCDLCGPLTVVEHGPEGRKKVLQHNLHSLADYAREWAATDPVQRKDLGMRMRSEALAAHPLAAKINDSNRALLSLRHLDRVG